MNEFDKIPQISLQFTMTPTSTSEGYGHLLSSTLIHVAQLSEKSSTTSKNRMILKGASWRSVLPTRKPLRPTSRLGRQQDSCELAGASHHNPLASSVALVYEYSRRQTSLQVASIANWQSKMQSQLLRYQKDETEEKGSHPALI
jgi:hypothetical protein